MAKKHGGKHSVYNSPHNAGSQQKRGGDGITSTGWKVILSGIASLIIGFFILSRTDPAGQNWASNISPFIMLASYGIIGAGILAGSNRS